MENKLLKKNKAYYKGRDAREEMFKMMQQEELLQCTRSGFSSSLNDLDKTGWKKVLWNFLKLIFLRGICKIA